MDNIGELMQPAGPAVQVQTQVRTCAKSSVAKTKLKTKQAVGKDEAIISTADEKYSLTIMPSSNSTKTTKIPYIADVAPQLQERLSLKSECVVNGVANGLDLDLKHNMVLNGNSDSTSHCDNSEICNGDVDNHQTITNTPTHCAERSSEQGDVEYVSYRSELQMPDIMRLIQKDLSEPYSIYTYRYFIHNWPKLCFLAMDGTNCVGAIVCKLDIHRKVVKRGYIAMLAVDEKYREKKIGSHLVLKAIRAMVADDADEVVLETEITNRPALRLYENLGFVRDKRLFRYYLNGVDALRLKLWLR